MVYARFCRVLALLVQAKIAGSASVAKLPQVKSSEETPVSIVVIVEPSRVHGDTVVDRSVVSNQALG
ncbi:hypothetical protein RRSWK_05836 [Rhodopirellula sp. SWK7]|nr:hypothetical protein RRSWK_05836 [Rhodopirellula sp. SWK7]